MLTITHETASRIGGIVGIPEHTTQWSRLPLLVDSADALSCAQQAASLANVYEEYVVTLMGSPNIHEQNMGNVYDNRAHLLRDIVSKLVELIPTPED